MRLYSGKKIGQSGNELVLAVFFSFFLHAALVVLALVVVTAVSPKVHIPLFYEVKLVGLPADVPPVTAEAPPEPPKAEPAPIAEPPKPQPKKAAPKEQKPAVKSDALPELARQEPKEERPAEAKPEPEKPTADTGGVAVSPASEDFPFHYYIDNLRRKIYINWNPPAGARGVKAKVRFTIVRSGRVVDTTLDEQSGYYTYDLAAMRAIQQSNPFPPLPEGFNKQSVSFSVDLVPKD